jgi:small subunit ribosomal protein S4
LKNYYNEAVNTKGNTGVILGQLLEQRLDNVIYRLGFAPTRASARQLVNHGHVAVEFKVVSVASYRVTAGEKISFNKEKTTKIPYIETQMANETLIVPEWLERKATQGKVVKMPDSQSIEKQVNMRSVIEFYSR